LIIRALRAFPVRSIYILRFDYAVDITGGVDRRNADSVSLQV
jgi:hypothetical protein